MSLTLALLLSLSPDPAIEVAARLEGLETWEVARLRGICWRESGCSTIAAHEIDAWGSRRGWRSQVRLGHLDASCQPYEPKAWATRGAWGLSAASHWAYLPACYLPHWLDVPLVSAIVAVRKWRARCVRGGRLASDRPGWCRARPRASGAKAARASSLGDAAARAPVVPE